MVQGGYLLPVSPRKFTWNIRRWLGLEISNIIRMKNTPSLKNEYKIRIALLGKDIFSYLIDKERRNQNMKYGRALAKRDGYEWSYLVSEDWIYENLEELYKSYLAMGCYYTVTSLYAFGKLDGELEAVTQDGDRIELTLSDSEEGDESTTYAMILRQDKVFRESLIASCISKLNLSTDRRILPEGKYLKNEEGAIERFKEFYIKELHTKKVTKGLLDRYNIPVVAMGTPALQEIHKLYVN